MKAFSLTNCYWLINLSTFTLVTEILNFSTDFGAALHLMRSDLEHLRSVFMAVENGDLGMLKSLGIKDSELGDVKFFLEKLVNTGFLDWVAPEPLSPFYYSVPIGPQFYSYLGSDFDGYNYWRNFKLQLHSMLSLYSTIFNLKVRFHFPIFCCIIHGVLNYKWWWNITPREREWEKCDKKKAARESYAH